MMTTGSSLVSEAAPSPEPAAVAAGFRERRRAAFIFAGAGGGGGTTSDGAERPKADAAVRTALLKRERRETGWVGAFSAATPAPGDAVRADESVGFSRLSAGWGSD